MIFDKFCFFLSLSSGAVVIGLTNVLYGLLQLWLEMYLAFTMFHLARSEPEPEIDVLYANNTLPTMQVLFGFYLIYGSTKEKPSVLLATIILHLAFVAHSVVFIGFALYEIEERSAHGWFETQLLDEALRIPVMLYFAFIVYGRMEEVEKASTMQREPIVECRNDGSSDDVRLVV